MALPTDTILMDALLKAAHKIGRAASVAEFEAEIIRQLDISPLEVTEKYQGERTKLNYRLAWCRTYLKGLGLLAPAGNGIWELTARGARFKSLMELQAAEPGALEEIFDESEGIEGIDSDTPEKFGEYPIESVLIRQETRTAVEVVRRINEGKFIMDPEFQRDFIWNPAKQSKLIESMLMRIPLPVFYLSERDDGKTVVVDGLQRLSTFRRFIADELILSGLELARELNGKKFSGLTPKLQNRVEDTQLILYLIDSKVPEQAKLDIFERVNGGVPLTRQQMRNSMYCGPATLWLKEEAKTTEFMEATTGSLDWRTMRDRECINRFCAFSVLGMSAYDRGDMDAFMATALKEMNRQAPPKLGRLSDEFRRSMRNNKAIFGSHAFRKHRDLNSRRSVINVALFDVFSVLFARVPEEEAANAAQKVREAFYSMMESGEFVDSISLSTNSTTKVKARFRIAESMLGNILPSVHTAKQ